MFNLFLLLLCILNFANTQRKILTYWNPGCFEKFCYHNHSRYYNLIYVKSESKSDTIHFLWSTIDIPSIHIVHSSSNTSLDINWYEFLNGSHYAFKWNDGQIWYKFALLIPQLYETYANDTHNKTLLLKLSLKKLKNYTYSDDSKILASTYNLKEVAWEDFRIYYNNKTHVGILTGYHQALNANISFKVSFFENESRALNYPHMLYSANSTEFVFQINQTKIYKLPTDEQIVSYRGHTQSLGRPRLSLAVVIMEERFEYTPPDYFEGTPKTATDNKLNNFFSMPVPTFKLLNPSIYNGNITLPTKPGPFEYQRIRTMDDEYTPGLFTMDQIQNKKKPHNSGFLQWKPIFFEKSNPSNNRDAKQLFISPLSTERIDIINKTHPDSEQYKSLSPSIQAVFNDRMFINMFLSNATNNIEIKTMILQHANFCFYDPHANIEESDTPSSIDNNGSITFTQFLAWHCITGFGIAPRDSISPFIMLLTCFGFGLPLALVFFAYTVGTVKLLRQKRRQLLTKISIQNTSDMNINVKELIKTTNGDERACLIET